MEENHYCRNCRRHISTANFATHSAFCERNIKVCKMCSEPIQISREKEHLEEFHVTVTCDLCKTVLEKWMLPEHQKSCTKRLVTCEYCDGDFPYEEYSEHFEFCSSRTEKCLLCQKYVMLKDKLKHSEIHMCEKRISHVRIANEEKENIINEVISGQIIQEKMCEMKNSSTNSDTVTANKDKAHPKISVSTGEGACALDTAKEMSKHYTICHICKQSIPWIDFNTHVPSCASNRGKCSRCGEDVPSHEIKDHILKKCKLLLTKDSSINKADLKRGESSECDVLYVTEGVVDVEDMKSCPYCKQLCSNDRIDEHVKSCSENVYECPLCLLKMPESHKKKHESFECHFLMKINTTNLSGHSWSDSNKKRNSNNKCKDSSKCEPCCPCHKNSHHRKQQVTRSKQLCSNDRIDEHVKNCSENVYECPLCLLKMPESDKMKHEAFECHILMEINSTNLCNRSVTELQSSYKGAIPKNSTLTDMIKPLVRKCRFCNTSLNADILIYHEKECVRQPCICPDCDAKYELKDFETHICKTKRKKGKHGKNEGKTELSRFGIKESFLGMFSNSGSIDGRTRFQSPCSFNAYGYDYSKNFSSNPVADDTKIPCEFCDVLISASDIILHETGCKPELVAFPKKISQDKVPIFHEQTSKLQQDRTSEKNFFSAESKINVLTSRSKATKKYTEIEEKVEPGEFLRCAYDAKSSESSKDHQIESSYSSSKSSIQSVWNVSSPDPVTEDSKKLPHISLFDEEKNTEKDISNEIQEQFEDKHVINSDDEMAEMLEYINKDETSASDKRVSNARFEEISAKYSKDSVFLETSSENLYSQRDDEADDHYLKNAYLKKNEDGEHHSMENKQDINILHTCQDSG